MEANLEQDDFDCIASDVRSAEDADELRKAAAGVAEQEEEGDGMIRSLHHAVSCGDRSPSNMFSRLWNLLMYLRRWEGGSDQHWLPNPRNYRKASSNLSWYQSFGLVLLAMLYIDGRSVGEPAFWIEGAAEDPFIEWKTAHCRQVILLYDSNAVAWQTCVVS